METKDAYFIDDSPSIVRTLTKILSKAGYLVEVARSGNEAVEKFKVTSYDAAIIDVGLGDMIGTDLLPQMKVAAPNMLKVILTGTPMPEGVEAASKRGADVLLLKPVKPETFLNLLKERLQKT